MARPASPLPSPASANSSSTLIVTPLILASKADRHLPPRSQSVVDEMSAETTEDTAQGPTTTNDTAASPLHPAASTGLHIASRQSTPSQTRMSERGFVEPHHSNVPRRTRTRGKAQVRNATRASSTVAPTPGGSPTSPSLPAPLILEPISNGGELDEEIEQPTTPLDTPNPNATRMPTRLLSLRLPPSPSSAAYPGMPSSTPLPYTPALQPTASTGLPVASSVPHLPRAGLPQGIGLGFGTPLSSAAITPGGPLRVLTPLTPGSGRLPTRRRKVGAVVAPSRGLDTTTPTRVFHGVRSRGVRGTSAGSDEEAALLALPAPAQLSNTPEDTPHGPPSYRAYRERMRNNASRVRRERMGLQRVGHMGGLEVGFIEGDGVLDWDLDVDLEDIPLDDTASIRKATPGLYVLLHEVDSDSDIDDSDSDSASNDEERVRGVRSLSYRRREREDAARRELRLALPSDLRALVDGTCALEASQLREACSFIRGVVRSKETESRTIAGGLATWTPTTLIGLARPHVRILTPRGRPEDAMGIAIAYLAYGEALAEDTMPTTPPTMTVAEVLTTSDTATANDDSSAVDDEDGEVHGETATADNTTDSFPGAARLIAQTARAVGIATPSRRASLAVPGALIDAIVDIEGGSPPNSLAVSEGPPLTPPFITGFSGEVDAAYTPAHLLAMRLLDEGDWLARPRPGAPIPTGDGGILGAGRGVVGVVDMARPGLGGLFGVDLDGEDGEDYEDEDEGDTDEGASAASTEASSAGARVDSHSGSEEAGSGKDDGAPLDAEDKNDKEERRGRTVAWHGVPMPPKFIEDEDDAASLSRERALLSVPGDSDQKMKSKSKSRARGEPKSKSKSKSRVRARSRSQRPQHLLNEDLDADVDGPDTSMRRTRTPAVRRAKAMRRAVRIARRVAEAETYAGIVDVWRGVLSYDGLAALEAVLSVWT